MIKPFLLEFDKIWSFYAISYFPHLFHSISNKSKAQFINCVSWFHTTSFEPVQCSPFLQGSLTRSDSFIISRWSRWWQTSFRITWCWWSCCVKSWVEWWLTAICQRLWSGYLDIRWLSLSCRFIKILCNILLIYYVGNI